MSGINWATRGFWKGIRHLVEDDEDYSGPRLRPDGWAIVEADDGRECVVALEVERTNILSDDKMSEYGALFWALDEGDVPLVVFVINPYAEEIGRIGHVHHYQFMVEKTERREHGRV